MSRDSEGGCSTGLFCVVVWRRGDRRGLVEGVLLFEEAELFSRIKYYLDLVFWVLWMYLFRRFSNELEYLRYLFLDEDRDREHIDTKSSRVIA